MKAGDAVRPIPRKGHTQRGVIGRVAELYELNGKLWARVTGRGKNTTITSCWPADRLEVHNKT